MAEHLLQNLPTLPPELAGPWRQTRLVLPSELDELCVCRLAQAWQGPLVWVVGENESFDERRQKLSAWLSFLGFDLELVCYQRPYEDPYLNNRLRWDAVLEKNRLYGLKDHAALLVLTTLSALQLPLEPRSGIAVEKLPLAVGLALGRDELVDGLFALGYRPVNMVNETGEASYRGAMVECFPPGADFPLRIEFQGDRVSGLRFYDPKRHKNLQRVSTYEVEAAGFFLGAEAAAAGQPLWSFLAEPRVIWSQKDRLEREFAKICEQFEQIRAGLVEQTESDPPQALSWSLEALPPPDLEMRWDEGPGHLSLPWRRSGWTVTNLDDTGLGELQAWLSGGGQLIRCRQESDSAVSMPLSGSVTLLPVGIPCSFIDTAQGIWYLTERSFSYQPPIEGLAQRGEGAEADFSPGDLVVHKDHGIGRVMGFKRMRIAGRDSEFVQIAYGGSETLYVPIYDLDVLSRYSALEEAEPTLDRLGGKTWERKKQRAQKSIITFARELLELYATRQAIKGNSFAKASDWEEKLAADFAFVETRDQKRAIGDVLADLERDTPMDRLVCGDVSFGKTEVALRSAFRVLSNGAQVALLCPTTILAEQHTRTFEKRLAPYGVRVACLTRRNSAKDRDEILAGLKTGRIDLLVGTHSLLSKSLLFKRLGLMIIDEEQRFGVFQKEQLKRQWPEVDVLTLSATPIPRTLSLAMAGLQDISIINSPPMGRLAVKNFVGYFTREIVVNAVNRELERNGQVFIVYNRIESLFEFAERIKPWLGDVELGVMHAQMSTREIETVLDRFLAGDLKVLISTTIIENGIDIPRVNTLLVIHADRFGLTQLYQLRGRIGRSDRQAYAYFLVEREIISEKAQKRLDGIRDFCELGAGYQLAAFDLRLRGGGSLLGNRQHGHIEALGFDYYNEMLRQAVDVLRGVEERQRWLKVKVNFAYGVGTDLIADEQERLDLYRTVHSARNFAALLQIRRLQREALGARAGELDILFYVAAAKLLCKQLGGAEIELDEGSFTMRGQGEMWVAHQMKVDEDLFLMERGEDGSVTLGFAELDRFVDYLLSESVSLPQVQPNLVWTEPF
jgi:transcription-repair coupling factor (superfamily II helicase)